MENSNKVAIVTGAAQNIGRSTCIELSKIGYNILIHANTDKLGAEKTLSLVKENGVMARVTMGDLTNEDFSQMIIRNAQELGKVSILVNNASQRNFINYYLFLPPTITGTFPDEFPGNEGTTCVSPFHLSKNNLKRT